MKEWFKENPLVTFAVKALAIYLIWYVAYELVILPDGRVDRWLSLNIISVSGGVLDLLGYDVYTAGRIIGIGESAGIMLVNGCNGLEAIGLFLGFVIAYPGDNVKRAIYIAIGMMVIYLVNVLRIVVLAITQVFWAEFFDFTHDYSTTAIFYMVIFVLWMIWANLGESPAASKKTSPNVA